MNTGLLWFDDDPKKSQERKIAEAAGRYWQRFAVAPSACYVSRQATGPAGVIEAAQPGGRTVAIDLPGAPGEAPRPHSLALVPSGAIRPNHFWVGVDETEPA